MAEYKEEVVISGIGGMFPESNSVEQLKDLLFNKVNGVTIDSRRWDTNELGIRHGTGKIKTVDNFDETFFQTHPKLAKTMDLLTRLMLERSIEAIIDAGLSPADLNGTNTAVFMSSAFSETEMLILNCSKNTGFSMLGRSRTMQANRLSYILNLTGPSFSTDGSWICSANNLEKAKTMIENGVITAAIVGVTNLCLRPEFQYQYQGLGKLNTGICTKPFSFDADGYNRSEACIVMLLQRASDAKRSYGTLLSVKSVHFGDNHGHITEHDGNQFKSLLLDSYKNANIDPLSVEYIEAYGSGIKIEDSIELCVMEEVFCSSQRKTPLKVGSVKSNVGHCEASGFFTSIVKAIIALDTGYIPPTINYKNTNESHAAIKNGKIQIVTEKSPLINDIIGISSFGFANAFSHVILKRNNKVKCSTEDLGSEELIPKLILASGRNEENVSETINMIKKYGNDTEFLALTYEVFTKNINSHFYRSFSIFPSSKESSIHDVWNVSPKKRPVWFIFSGMGSQWHGMGLYLMKLPIFADAIDKCDSILKPKGVDIKHILTSLHPEIFNNILNSFVGIAAIQIGLVDLLKALDIVPDGIIGHSVGELGCAYADGCFTAEEMLLSAYARGRASLETDLIPGMMAAIGIGYHQIRDRLPSDIDVACRNSASSCTLSGPRDSINEFVSLLKSEGIFAKTVNVAGIAFHSRYIQAAGPILLKYLKEVINDPKPRSSKWISTSLPESKWNSDLSMHSSAEYHTNNLLSSVLFEDALKHIPSDAITIEIAPHGLLQSILRKTLAETVSNIPMTKKIHGDSVHFLLSAIGKMYSCGMNPKIQRINPKITFPVSRNTPPLSNLPLWSHTHELSQREALSSLINNKSAEKFTSLVLPDEMYLIEYQIHSHHIIPLSYILFNVWKFFIQMNEKNFDSEPIKFKNLRVMNNIELNSSNSSENYLMIQQGSGLFEYSIDKKLVFSGQISFFNKSDLNSLKIVEPINLDSISDKYEGYVYKDEIYSTLENNGYFLGNNYKNIVKFVTIEKLIHGYVKWTNDWIYFIDGLLKFTLLDDLETQGINVPVSIREIEINPSTFQNILEKDVHVSYNKVTKEITCAGVKILDVKNCSLLLPKLKCINVKLEEKKFVQFDHATWKNIDEFIEDSIKMILEIDRLNVDSANEKLICCTPYHYGDSIFKACTETLKNVLYSQLSINTLMMTWDDIKNTSKYDESGIFILVTNVNYLRDTIKVVDNKKCSYIFVSSEQKILDLKEWKIIMQQKFNDSSYLSLIKQDEIIDENSVIVKQTNDSSHSNVSKILENHNGSRRMIYIISKSEPLEGIHNYVKNMLTKYKTRWLRFLFILDSTAPDIDTDELFYKNQMAKGSIVNIYKSGGWGFYKRIIVQNLKENMILCKNPSLNNLKINSETTLTVKYLGLNYKDLVVEDTTENEFGPLDYSGHVKNGEKIIGIASFKQKCAKLKFDSFLSWPAPSAWSLEDATTVPLSYAMSYYVFNVLCSLQRKSSILITSGLHPIGQAAIAIGLAEKCEMYAVVESSEDAEQLSNIFPELPPSRIIVNKNDKFDVKLMMMTKSKGINLVLNFLMGEALQAAFRTIAYHGKFFHFSKSDIKTYGKIGTRVFLRNISFTIVSSSMLLNESDQNKRIVRLAFMDGLNKGVIKCFSRFDLTKFSNNRNIFDAMRTASTLCAFQKVVLSVIDVLSYSKSLNDSECDTSYQCHSDEVNVIIANKLDWLDVAEWLADRRAKRIVIVVKRCLMSSTNCRRFDRLISCNLSIQIEPNVYLKTKDESLNWLNRLTSSNTLGSLFIINELSDTKVNNLRYAFEEIKNKTKMSSFVCMSSNGDLPCTELKLIGLKAFNISWDKAFSQPKTVSKMVPLLDTLLQQTNFEISSSFICSEKSKDKSEWSQKMNEVMKNYFPNSVDDLHGLNDIIRKDPGFIEVQTKSPRFSHLKSVVPVFVIPGFRPKLFKTLYKEFSYPVFEARLPENIESIDKLSRILIDEINRISNKGSVSLIGESWGGILALKMAQQLEAQGTLVTVSLLNGDPKTVISWAECFLSKDYYNNKLNLMYSSQSDELLQYTRQLDEKDFRTLKMSVYNKSLDKITKRALNWINSCLRASLETKPLPNKLHTKIVLFKYKKMAEHNEINNLIDYCINSPYVHIVPGNDYKQMMVDIKMINHLTKIIVYPYTIGNEMSLCDKYKNFYFNNEKLIKCIN